ncbi:hypothetical protein GCM10023215_07200 [Pseudonocardia yuanmonensis]|uniref:Uncharacterized protein n=1 Tax=Pseudonocardia yuanmonensis TaxID=1095914 RepID=A0ABP8W0R5_9PSEU
MVPGPCDPWLAAVALTGTALNRKDRAVAELAEGRADTGAGCADAELFLV